MHFLHKSFCIHKIWIYGESIKKNVIYGGTWFYFSHMVVSVFPRAQR